MKTKALYAGSFDPITLGHLDVVAKAASIFDHVHVGVGVNPRKSGLFSVNEKVELIRGALREQFVQPQQKFNQAFSTGRFQGSVVSYAREIGATHIVRGLRQVSDFNDEFTYHGVLQRIAPDIPVVHLICDQKFLHVSSSTARELASINEGLSWLVTKTVEDALRSKFN